MTLVVDASVALKLFVSEPDSAAAEALYVSGEFFLAPDLVLAEVANGLWKLARRSELSEAQFLEAIIKLPLVYGELVPLDMLLEAAANIARDIDHPVYDCFYLALAEARAVPLVTADKRLVARVAGSRFAPLVRPL